MLLENQTLVVLESALASIPSMPGEIEQRE